MEGVDGVRLAGSGHAAVAEHPPGTWDRRGDGFFTSYGGAFPFFFLLAGRDWGFPDMPPGREGVVCTRCSRLPLFSPIPFVFQMAFPVCPARCQPCSRAPGQRLPAQHRLLRSRPHPAEPCLEDKGAAGWQCCGDRVLQGALPKSCCLRAGEAPAPRRNALPVHPGCICAGPAAFLKGFCPSCKGKNLAGTPCEQQQRVRARGNLRAEEQLRVPPGGAPPGAKAPEK